MCHLLADVGRLAVRTTRVIMAVVIASLVSPPAASAQSAGVLRTLAALRTTLDGTFGDEGGEVERRLGDLSAAVADGARSTRDADLTLDPDGPVATYLALARAGIDEADLARATDTLVRAVREHADDRQSRHHRVRLAAAEFHRNLERQYRVGDH